MENFFENLIPLIAVTGIFVVFPVLLFRHFAQRRDGKAQNSSTISTDLLDLADRMEKRIDTLERLLDVEAPGWRERHHEQH
ncbi:MAG TPA: envelope stress response membrane protein PspB [Solimonas sp.]